MKSTIPKINMVPNAYWRMKGELYGTEGNLQCSHLLQAKQG